MIVTARAEGVASQTGMAETSPVPEEGLREEVAEEGRLWSARARDWAEFQEGFLDPCYLEILERSNLKHGYKVLDIGCGAGRFLQLAAERGADVSGLDAAAGMLDIARTRIPQGNFRLGDMESLPFDDDLFDLVSGFNSFSHAGDPQKALREAGRVAKPGGLIALTVWGSADPNSMRAVVLKIVHSLVGPSAAGADGEEHLHSITAEADLQELCREAGLLPGNTGEVRCRFIYPDTESLLKGLMSPGPFVEAAEHAGEDAVRKKILEAMEPYANESSAYLFLNTFRYVIATTESN